MCKTLYIECVTESAIIARNPDTKAEWRTLKGKNGKAQRTDQKSGRHEEVNYVGSSIEVLFSDPNILSIENPV